MTSSLAVVKKRKKKKKKKEKEKKEEKGTTHKLLWAQWLKNVQAWRNSMATRK